MSEPKIRIDSLSVAYASPRTPEPLVAIDELSLSIAEREFVCIVGPSGCGKTTLLRVLAGLEQATGGNVQIRHGDPERPLLTMVFHNARLFPWLTVEENVAYGCQLRNWHRRRPDLTRHWLAEVGLAMFGGFYPAQLSAGMQQRVGLARAFAYDAEVLLMDEPFGALDAQTRLLLQQTLLRYWEHSAKTIIFVTHSIEEALALGDRVYVMSARPGRLLYKVPVPFKRPREIMALHADEHFRRLVMQIWDVLRAEVEQTRAAELEPAL